MVTYKLWQIFKKFYNMEWTPGYGTKNTGYLQPSMKKNLKNIDWTYKVQYPEGQELQANCNFVCIHTTPK